MSNVNHNDRIAYLILDFLSGTLTIERAQELNLWLDKDPANQAMFADLADPVKRQQEIDLYNSFDVEASRRVIERENNKNNQQS